MQFYAYYVMHIVIHNMLDPTVFDWNASLGEHALLIVLGDLLGFDVFDHKTAVYTSQFFSKQIFIHHLGMLL